MPEPRKLVPAYVGFQACVSYEAATNGCGAFVVCLPRNRSGGRLGAAMAMAAWGAVPFPAPAPAPAPVFPAVWSPCPIRRPRPLRRGLRGCRIRPAQRIMPGTAGRCSLSSPPARSTRMQLVVRFSGVVLAAPGVLIAAWSKLRIVPRIRPALVKLAFSPVFTSQSGCGPPR